MWLKLHKPELLEKFQLSEFEKHLMEQGNEVESYARNLFPGGIEVVSTGEDACHETTRLMVSKVSTIFQATFIVDGFIARNDMLVHDPNTDHWDLYEVKATNSVKENTSERDHIDDLAFQFSVLKRAGVSVGKCFLVHMNKEYVRHGDLDIHTLFIIEDETEKVLAKLPEMEKNMELARDYLTQEKEPVGNCECLYKGRRNHCTTFKHSNSHVPDYSVHDLSYVTKKKLDMFIEKGVFDLADVTEEFDITDNQRNQVLVHQRQKPIIDKGAIKEVLDSLSFPLYFFDYEAYGPAIPAFDGYSPYKRIPFQFSLHVLKTPTSELEHVEFLHDKLTDPSEEVAKVLKEHIMPGGTVIAWHKSYEAGVNKEIGARLPEYASLFESMNNSLYDLKEIFSKQLYIHHDFKGKSSIKKVLPAIIPDLRYSDLDIREGGQAADSWWTMVSPSTTAEEKAKINKDLKTYCGMDTFAMYKIWEHLKDVIG